MLRHLFTLLFCVLLAGPGVALAQPAAKPLPDTVQLEAQEAQAKLACDGGRVQDGVRLLTQLLNQTKDGTYIFNLARCYQQNGQLEQALVHFRAYLRRPDVDPAAAARAREYVAVLERRPAAATPPPPANDVRSASIDTPELGATAGTTRGSPGRALRIGGLVVGGAGLAALATGFYYARQTQTLNDETDRADQAGDKPPSWYVEQNKKGVRAERRQWLFLGSGAAAVATGGVLYYLGTRTSEQRQPTLLVLVPLPRGGQALLKGRF
jgi:hypothetical protein